MLLTAAAVGGLALMLLGRHLLHGLNASYVSRR